MFNGVVASWDTSRVTNMGQMFYEASSFNSNVSAWNTSSVANMEYMFYGAEAFDQELCWDVRSVTSAGTDEMFYGSSGSFCPSSPTSGQPPEPTMAPTTTTTTTTTTTMLKAANGGPDNGALQAIGDGDVVINYWSLRRTKKLFRDLWSAVFYPHQPR